MEKQMIVQVVGWSGKGAGSGVIKRMTRGKYSHVSLRFKDIEKEVRDLIRDKFAIHLTSDHEIESIQFKGVIHHSFEGGDNCTLFNFEQTPEQSLGILKTAIGLLGKKYDWRGIGGFVTRRRKHNEDKWFCSELASHCLMMSGVVLLHWPPFMQSPNFMLASPRLLPD